MQMPPGCGDTFKPSGDVDAVAVNIAFFDDDVADMDANAELDAACPAARRRCARPCRAESQQRSARRRRRLRTRSGCRRRCVLTMRPRWSAIFGSMKLAPMSIEPRLACLPRRLPSGGCSRRRRRREIAARRLSSRCSTIPSPATAAVYHIVGRAGVYRGGRGPFRGSSGHPGNANGMSALGH